jgi:hypothetical protein
MTDPVFNVGDMVTPTYTSGYHLTMGNVYAVVSYDPPLPDMNFTWPAYVEVLDDRGKLVAAHARRLELV